MVERRMDPLAQLTGDSPAMVAVRKQLQRVLERQTGARRSPPILILGETGTGKGLLARALHHAGPRAGAQFVDVNCAAIPEAMFEAEMFGFERGAFTDAHRSKTGLFQTAHRGTLFLDEVGLLPLALQGKLLKALEERAVRPLGGTQPQPADVWVLSATSEDLPAAVRDRRFREDLYQRLNLLTVSLPPLRDRGDDVLLIARHFLAQACEDYGLPSRELTLDASAALRGYTWPGNVRELANVMERVALLSDVAKVSAEALDLRGVLVPKPPEPSAEAAAPLLSDAVARVEREHLVKALEHTGWNITRAAADLGISRDTLRYRITKQGLQPPTVSPTRRPRTREEPAPAPSALIARDVAVTSPVRWDERRIARLRVALSPASAEDTPGRTGLELIVEKVRALGGAVQELHPAGLVAAFGLEPVDDAPRRAAHTALVIRKAAERAREAGELHALVRMAIDVGPLPVAEVTGTLEIEPEARREAWAVLEAMVTAAEPDEILASESAWPSLERRFELVPVGHVAAVPGQVHRVIGHARSELEVDRRIGPFVGRGEDLAVLGRGMRSAIDGQGRTIGIVGEAGLGKSRLLFEFHRRLEWPAIDYISGRCLSYGGGTPYLPLTDVIRNAFGIADTDASHTIVERIGAGLAALGLDSSDEAPCLLRMLEVDTGSADSLTGLSPEAVKERTFETLRQVLARRAQQQPLVLVLEDLHWIDRTSEEWLASLVESLPRARMLLLVTYRPGYRPPWIERSDATQLSLGALGRAESLAIVESTAPIRLTAEVAESIVDRASGNPFFLEELCRAVAEQRGMPPTVPGTVQDVLRARIDRLSDRSRQLLQTAAVAGRTARAALVRAIWDGSGGLEPHFRELARLEFLYKEGAGEETGYVFKHALVQEVAYESLPEARRQALHAAAGRALETLYPSRLHTVVDRLAYHYARSTEADRAVAWLGTLADKAARALAHLEALTAVEEALEHVERLRTEDQDHALLTLILRRVGSLTYLGRFEEIIDTLLQHRDRLERLDDPSLTGRYFFWLARTYSILGEPARTVEHARRALAEATRCGDSATKGKAHFALAYECFWSGRPAEGVERAREAVTHLESTDERRWVGDSYWLLGINHAALGNLEQALEAHDRQQEIADATADARLRCSSILSSGSVRALAGEWKLAIETCRQGLELAPDPVHRALGMGFLGGTYLEQGDAVQAIPLLEEAARSYAQFRVRQTQGWFTALLGEAYLRCGDAERARAVAAEGLEIVTAIGYRWGIGWAQRVLGRIALAHGPVLEAERHLADALATFTGMSARHDVARTGLDVARLAHRRGDREATRAHLQTALQLFTDLRIPRYTQATRELAEELQVPLRP
jgi:DNA-binding NtrC family response regulator/tetratricopeptide (TPR) repeat protein